MIDPTIPVATPFRANWATNPRTDFEFKTGIITAADGREQRHPQLRSPRVRVSYECLATTTAHAQRIAAAVPALMNSAVAVRDFRMNGAGVVSADGTYVVMNDWSASWAPTTRVVIEDSAGLVEHTAVITGTDPVNKTVLLDGVAPLGMRGRSCRVGSAVVASLDQETSAGLWHASAATWSVSATSYGGLDQIGGSPLGTLPLRHGAPGELKVSLDRRVSDLDFGIGRRASTLGYGAWTSGFRTYQLEARQLGQSAKESLVSFYCGSRGRLRAFDAPQLIEGAKFRFASDTLVVEHLSGNVSQATASVVQVIQ